MTSDRSAGSMLRLAHTPMGGQAGLDPREHPRWDGEQILPYEPGCVVCGGPDENGDGCEFCPKAAT